MLSNLKGYTPENVQFVLEDSVKEKFPQVLNFGEVDDSLTSAEDAIKFVSEQFTATFPENETTERHLDDFEVCNIREEYCVLQEEVVPQRKRSLEETLEAIKAMKRKAEQAYESTLMEVANYAAQVKQGTKEIQLKSTETFRIALNGYYLIYTWAPSKKAFLLAKAFKVPCGPRELWAQEDKNRKAMKDLFNLDFPEPVSPNEEDIEDTVEAEDDLPFE